MNAIIKIRWEMLAMGVACTFLGAVVGGGTAMAYQGHMWNALNDLQAAQGQLQAAETNKGGHRDAALSLVAQAIGEVKAGIAYAQ